MPRHNNYKPESRRPIRVINCAQKRKFKTKAEADRAADDRMLYDLNLQLTSYKCESCTAWHLTSHNNSSDY